MENSTRPEQELPTQPASILDSESEPNATRQFFSPKTLSANDRLEADEASGTWREELSERVVTFRKRRDRLPAEGESSANLELEFAHPDKPEDGDSLFQPQAGADGSGFELDIGKPSFAQYEGESSSDSPRTPGMGEEVILDTAPEFTDEMSLGGAVERTPPMEILVGAPTQAELENQSGDRELFYAPLSRRLLAGLTDALILFVGAAIFGGIFWYSMTQFCDHNSLIPFDVAVFCLAGVIVIFAYFAIFTAISSASPGLSLMGCEVRNLQGEHPTLSESLWRAFGILVSMSALMVGFIWAYVDSDNLTWHDRMSDTIITEAQTAAQLAGLKAES
jgi:uncharacterized RDD family membrane protein YckC